MTQPETKTGNQLGNMTGTKSASAPVLLIEDEPAVMALVRAVLEGHGYSVVPTESGAEALRLLAEGNFHGVVSDMRTPGGVDGAQVYAWIAAHRPGTGHAPGVHHRRYGQRGNRCHAAPHRRALRGKAVSRAGIYFRGPADHGQGCLMTQNLKTQNLTSPSLMTHDFRIRLLIVDDEQTIRRLCMTVGESLGFFCLEAESGDAALALLEEQPVHMILTDMVMPRMSGLEFLEQVKRDFPAIEVAVMTGHGSVETAVQAMKLGAYDYIAKPFAPLDDLRLFLRRMADKVRLVEENLYLRERSETETAVHGIIGSSASIQHVLRLISRLKDTRTPVLISGESGTGKELVARALHFRGNMASRPFVAVDCGSLVPTLIESELFGYEKGAFTGALRSKQGLLQSADTGTIFLDEVGELPLEMQARLLRFIQEKEVRPVGSNQKVKVDVRIMAATNRDLDAEYKKGTFRKDLYFRLNVVTISLPPLRERRSDIPILAAFFLERLAPGRGVQVSGNAMKALLAYDWPGNVRELENCLERAVALGDQRILEVNDLPPSIANAEIQAEALESREFSGRADRPPRHRLGRHRARHHRARFFPGQRRQGAGRENARHQPRHPLSQAEALPHWRPRRASAIHHVAMNLDWAWLERFLRRDPSCRLVSDQLSSRCGPASSLAPSY